MDTASEPLISVKWMGELLYSGALCVGWRTHRALDQELWVSFFYEENLKGSSTIKISQEGGEVLLWIRNIGITVQKCPPWGFSTVLVFSQSLLLIGSIRSSCSWKKINNESPSWHCCSVALDCHWRIFSFVIQEGRKTHRFKGPPVTQENWNKSEDNSFTAWGKSNLAFKNEKNKIVGKLQSLGNVILALLVATLDTSC